MPLKGLRGTSSERETKLRRSTLDPFTFAKRPNPTDIRSHSSVDLPQASRDATAQDAASGQLESAQPAAIDISPPPSPEIQHETPKTKRFSIMRFRHASDSQLSIKAKEQASAASTPPVPAIPPAPQIIKTAPTMERSVLEPPKKMGRLQSFARRRLSFDPSSVERPDPRKMDKRKTSTDKKRGLLGNSKPAGIGAATAIAEGSAVPERLSVERASNAPGELGSERPSFTLTVPRLSDSSTNRSEGRSEGSSGDHVTFAHSQRPSMRTPQGNHAHSFFKLPRRSKNRNSLFPLPVKIPPPAKYPDTAPATPRASTSAISTGSPERSPDGYSPPLTAIRKGRHSHDEHGQSSTNGLTTPAPPFGGPLFRNDSTASARSARSSPARPGIIGLRGRSSTMGSLSGRSDEIPPPTPPFASSGFASSGRNSTSTAGRSSLSNLFGIGHRFRQNSEPHSPRYPGSPAHGMPGTPGFTSHQNSMNISREALVLPKREEGEPPGKYLERLLDVVDRSEVAAVMSKSDDEFHKAVLRSYMRKFLFFGEPLDMSVRKLLLEVDLPKETQQIDRVLQGFADRYHECNPGIYRDADQAYFISFSILILHTDFFNKNNKRKMQKTDYLKNASSEGVSEDVLGCFYDNICYTPFIHFEDGIDIKETSAKRNKKSILKTPIGSKDDPVKKAIKEPIDPYTLILDGKLDVLRPPIREVMNLNDPYTYHGTATDLDVRNLHNAFFRYGILQIESSRSRPEAFAGLMDDPSGMDDERAGVVEMPVTKVGVLWRKDIRKRTARSPWQEWGAVLTRSGLSFFKNAGWVKGLMHQHEAHQKRADGTPVIFSPALQDFKSDHYITMDGAVGLMDSSYKNHKYAFAIFAKGGVEEVFRAENESEMNDWLAKINYSAAFATSGVRPRGLVGGRYEGQRTRGIRRLESSQSTTTVQTATGTVQITSGRIDPQLAATEATHRREAMQQKIVDSESDLISAVKQLDNNERDARHLLIVAPVQPKSREHVVHAAGRLAAKLKWTRIEMWRMRCHRDVLLMDLEEEKRRINEREARYQQIASQSNPSPAKSSHSILARLSSKGSIAHGSQKSPQSPVLSVRPGTKSSIETEQDVYKTPPEGSRQNSPRHTSDTFQVPALSLIPQTPPAQADRRSSVVSSSSQSPAPIRRGSTSTTGDAKASESLEPNGESESRYATPIGDDERRDAMFTPLDGRPLTASSVDEDKTPQPGASPPSQPGSPESRSKVRRSLHRTLRDSRGEGVLHHHHHRRSGKGKESSGSLATEEASAASMEDGQGLSRAQGSFTVHGKKASVITFGAEWGNMPADERLKVRKQAATQQEEDKHASAASAVGEEGRLLLERWIMSGRDRAPSMASESTTTAASIRQELRQELANGNHTAAAIAAAPVGAAVALVAGSGDESLPAKRKQRGSSRDLMRNSSNNSNIDRPTDSSGSLLSGRKGRPESIRTASQDDRSSIHQSIDETAEEEEEDRSVAQESVGLQGLKSQAVEV